MLFVKKNIFKNMKRIHIQQQLLFKIVSILLPFVVIAMLELLLRLTNVGVDTSIFIKSPIHKGYMMLNPAIGHRYFANKKNATKGVFEEFRAKKDGNTVRIFVQGASTVVGYPYYHSCSFSRLLAQRLRFSFPEKNIEVINVAMTAVNSYTLLDMGRELVKWEPDAILIYAGHNEYYGAMGVGASFNAGQHIWLNRLEIKMRTIRIYQILESFVVSHLSHDRDYEDHNLMERMASKQSIVFGSKEYLNGIDQFKANMQDLLIIYQLHHIPVFLSTLSSNLKDFAPFISRYTKPDQSVKKEALYAKSLLMIEKKDTLGAKHTVSSVLAIDSLYPQANYLMAGILYGKGEYVTALKYYVRAKDLDPLRFRAPSDLNSQIKKFASSFSTVHLVDIDSSFRKHSPGGIPGNNLFTEHVHPNLLGHFIMAEAFYESLMPVIFNTEPSVSANEASQFRAVTDMDSIYGLYNVLLLKGKWPFNEPLNSLTIPNPDSAIGRLSLQLVTKQKIWADLMMEQANYVHGRGKQLEALRCIEALSLEFPLDESFPEKSADFFLTMGNPQFSLIKLRQSFQINSSVNKARRIVFLGIKNNLTESLPFYLNYIINNDPSDHSAPQMLNLLKSIGNMTREMPSHPDILWYNKIAEFNLILGNEVAAKSWIHKADSLAPGNKRTAKLREKLSPAK
jgi:tetratricopeptide (TPR) repeat protein